MLTGKGGRFGLRSYVWLCVALLISACGAGRSIVDLKVPGADSALATGPAFRLVRVVDARRFESHPRDADIPSLNDADVTDPALTARALGRKRGSFGKARGDIMLPETSSVGMLSAECLKVALARSGGALVTEGDPRYATAIPLDLTVERLWSWFRPGAFQVAVEFDAVVVLRGAIPGFEQGVRMNAHATYRAAMINDARWKQTVEEGVQTLANNIAQALRPGLSQLSAPGAAPALTAQGSEAAGSTGEQNTAVAPATP